jgi:hypothetical protein
MREDRSIMKFHGLVMHRERERGVGIDLGAG